MARKENREAALPPAPGAVVEQPSPPAEASAQVPPVGAAIEEATLASTDGDSPEVAPPSDTPSGGGGLFKVVRVRGKAPVTGVSVPRGGRYLGKQLDVNVWAFFVDRPTAVAMLKTDAFELAEDSQAKLKEPGMRRTSRQEVGPASVTVVEQSAPSEEGNAQ